MNKRKGKIFGLATIALVVVFAMVIGLMPALGATSVSAESSGDFITPGSLSGPIITQTNPLFMRDGSHNSELVSQLFYLSQAAERGAPNLHVNHTGVPAIEVSDANHIREINDGALPDIMLFQPHGDFSITGMNSGVVSDQSRDNFTHSRWRLVYITHTDGETDPIFTFRMVESYRNNRMHSTDVDWLNVLYENSDLRFNLLDEFESVLDLFDNSNYLRNNFVAPADIPGAL